MQHFVKHLIIIAIIIIKSIIIVILVLLIMQPKMRRNQFLYILIFLWLILSKIIEFFQLLIAK
jgi:hypothetical protein